MQMQRTLGFMVAATVAFSTLVGCQSPMQTGAPHASTYTQPGGDTALAQAIATAMGEERELADLDLLAEEALTGYAVMAVGGPPAEAGEAAITAEGRAKADTANANAQSQGQGALTLEERLAAIRTRVQTRLAAKAELKAQIGQALKDADETVDAQGNRTKTATFEAGSRTITMTRTVDAEGKLVHSENTSVQTGHNGGTRTKRLERTFNTDGSMTLAFHHAFTLSNGMSRVADWVKTVGAGGGVTGTGTITFTRPGGETEIKTLTFSGTLEAPQAASETDDGETASVTLPVDGQAKAELKGANGNRPTQVDESAE